MSIRKHDVEQHEEDERVGREAYARAVNRSDVLTCERCKRAVRAPNGVVLRHVCEHEQACLAERPCDLCEAVRNPVPSVDLTRSERDQETFDAISANRKCAARVAILAIEHTPAGSAPWADDYRATLTDWLSGNGSDLGETVAHWGGVLLGLSLAGVVPEDVRVMRANLRYVAASAVWWASRPSNIVVHPGKVPSLEARAREIIAAIGNRA